MTFWSETREGGVVTLRHANPPRHTLTAQGVRELAERVEAVAGDATLRVHATLFPPAEALARGLVHRIFPAARFDAEVQAFAADLAARAPIALAAAKRAIRAGVELPLAEGLALAQETFEWKGE
jgi:enoyl-CoA hydratase/carnithine racemase